MGHQEVATELPKHWVILRSLPSKMHRERISAWVRVFHSESKVAISASLLGGIVMDVLTESKSRLSQVIF